MKIKYFNETGYNHLFDTIPQHTELYGMSSNCEWIEKEFGTTQYFKESRIDAVLPPLDPEMGEYANTVQIYDSLKMLTPKQASNPYLWAYLTHCEYWSYTAKRWSKPDMSVNTIKERFFCGSEEGSRTGFLRNSIARLWWTGYLSFQEDKPSNPFALTQLLCSNSDLRVSIVERYFSMNKDVCIGILSAIQEINDDPTLDDVGTSPITGEYEWRDLCKYINRFGAVTMLDALTREEIKQLSKEYILKQRQATPV